MNYKKIGQLIFGAGGIYGAFLYYGTLQEDVLNFKAADGTKFKEAWFLTAIEALANVVFGAIGLLIFGYQNLAHVQKWFAISGATQVCAKAFTTLAMTNGLSFPVVTLAKSAKMLPVMIGTILLGNATYTLADYASVLSIIFGTCMVSLGNKKKGGANSQLGIAFIVLSLLCDGAVGGLQKRVTNEAKKANTKVSSSEMMFWTNLYMTITAAAVAMATGEFFSGYAFCINNPVIFEAILKFALVSAVGQSFIFYFITTFDSLTTTTVTTTRKVFSVLLSIFVHGHAMSNEAWCGLALACVGIMYEIYKKVVEVDHSAEKKTDDKKKK